MRPTEATVHPWGLLRCMSAVVGVLLLVRTEGRSLKVVLCPCPEAAAPTGAVPAGATAPSLAPAGASLPSANGTSEYDQLGQRYKYEVNVDYTGVGLQLQFADVTAAKADTVAACADLCDANADCNFFTWTGAVIAWAGQENCYLKNIANICGEKPPDAATFKDGRVFFMKLDNCADM